MRTRNWFAAVLASLAALAVAPSASAQLPPYQANDFGGFRNILPAGEGQTVNGAELLAFEANGTLPAHYDDQRLMYQDLIHATPELLASQIDDFYKDGSFGVKPGDVAAGSPYHPGNRPGLTVIRDAGFGVPHVYGNTRADVMFGAGYVGAEDRLFLMDVLRHAGRADLSSFAGGSQREMDASVWDNAPYTEADLQRQLDLADDVYGAEGAALVEDLTNYVAGINQYISEAQTDPEKMPGEYAAIGKPLLPWKGTDVIATASLIGGIFGKGGGGELGNAEVFNSALAKFGVGDGPQVWQDFRRANDPEADTTVHSQSFPYQDRNNINPAAVAMPDVGSLVDGSPDDASGGGGGLGGLLGPLGDLLGGSNALLVSGAESESGRPVTVFGPQVGYFAPEILMEEDLHGPGVDARGATFPGVNLYVLLGRGPDYAWSATSAGQDIIDTFAEKLCEPDGPDAGTDPDPGTIDSMHYLYDPPGATPQQCRAIEVLNRDQLIVPNPGDQAAPGPYHLEAQRTVHGIVSKRGKVNGVPVAFAKLRSSYFHEADSARAFADMNDPAKIESAGDFQHAFSKMNLTFNWFYTDDKDISYFNSGDNPVRAQGADPEFPTWGTGEFDWQGWDPVLPENGSGLAGGTNIADYTPFGEHPQVTNQNYISSWNNKQAPGYRAAEDNYSYGPNHRVQSLDERIEQGIAGSNKMSLAELIDAMEDAGSVDLRGSQVLPLMLDVIGQGPGPPLTAAQANAVTTLRNWANSGAHRRDRDSSGTYDDAAAVALMDAWWDPPGDPFDPNQPNAKQGALEAAFRPALGDDLFKKVKAQMGFDDPPGPVGSAYISGWYGYLNKDLRALLGRAVTDPFSRRYCGDGNLTRCRAALLSSLDAAIAQQSNLGQLYPEAGGCLTGGGGSSQMCHDAIRFTTVGAVSVDPIEWINRPTWQQAVEVQGHRGRGGPISSVTTPGTAGTGAKTCVKRKGKKSAAESAKKKRKKCHHKKKRRK